MNAPAKIEPAGGGHIMTSDEAMALATRDTMLTPRFYTTDFDALDAIDVSLVREEWDQLISDMVGDPNKTHFRDKGSFAGVIESLEPELRAEFTDFMVSSMTSEFSGCVLYAEIARRTSAIGRVSNGGLAERPSSARSWYCSILVKIQGVS